MALRPPDRRSAGGSRVFAVFAGLVVVVAGVVLAEYFSTDRGGNAAAVHSQAAQPDTVAPNTQVLCNGAACGAVAYRAPVTVTLPATDSGGSGLARTVFTTDGSDPATSSTARTYAGAFTLSRTATVTAVSADGAQNIGQRTTATIRVMSRPVSSRPVSSRPVPSPPVPSRPVADSGRTTLTPTDDTYTAKVNPGAAHGSEGSINVNSGIAARRSYLKFTVSTIPARAKRIRAVLRLYSQSGAPPTVTFTVSRTSPKWNETMLTWNNQPAPGAIVTTKAGIRNGAFNAFNLSSVITGNGTYAVVITDNDTTQRYLSSKEASASQRPKLVLSWTSR